MGKSINKIFPFVFIFLILLIPGSCSSSKPSVLMQSILLNRAAEVSIRYEYDVVTINIPVIVTKNEPTAYRLSMFSRKSPSELFIERLFFPEDDIQVVLPRAIFNTDTLGNVAVLEPIGGDFEKLTRLFTLSRNQEQNLGIFQVRPNRDILKIYIFSRAGNKPLPLARVQVQKAGIVLAAGITDSLGYARLELERDEKNEIPLKISVDTNGLYPLWKRDIIISESGLLKQYIFLGSLKSMEEGVVLYKVIRDLSPLREGPENGAPTKFLLSYGDRFYASKVAGERLYGEVEVFSDDSRRSTFFRGWILKNLVELEN